MSRARTRSELHSSVGAQQLEHVGGPGRLLAAGVVELGVELALHPPLVVPGGPAVPEQDELSHGAAEVTSAGSGIVGQSRHSRSRA